MQLKDGYGMYEETQETIREKGYVMGTKAMKGRRWEPTLIERETSVNRTWDVKWRRENMGTIVIIIIIKIMKRKMSNGNRIIRNENEVKSYDEGKGE